MSLKDVLFRRTATIEMPGPIKPRPLSLKAAPTFQPLVAADRHPIDAHVAALWLAYQRDHRPADWSQFMANLVREVEQQTREMDDLRARLRSIAAEERYVP